MIDPVAVELARQILHLARERSMMITTAESCTGGLISTLLTDLPGSSDIFERGFVTYSNRAKQEALGVPFDLLEKHGAVSREVAQAMAEGALVRSAAQIAVAVTGIAGPSGGSEEKPVGLVHIAARSLDGFATHNEFRFGAKSRSDIRSDAARAALSMLIDALAGKAYA